MGKDLKGREIGVGIVQQPNGTYFARFVDKFGKRRTKRSKKLQEVRQWLAEATYIDAHSDLEQAANMLVDAWFEYWIGIKKQTVRPNTVRNGTPVKNSTYDTGLFKCCDRAGIPRFSMHVLRHTFATRCIEGGMKPKTLQRILGHSNISITMNLYVHITEDEKQKEIDLVADALKVV